MCPPVRTHISVGAFVLACVDVRDICLLALFYSEHSDGLQSCKLILTLNFVFRRLFSKINTIFNLLCFLQSQVQNADLISESIKMMIYIELLVSY